MAFYYSSDYNDERMLKEYGLLKKQVIIHIVQCGYPYRIRLESSNFQSDVINISSPFKMSPKLYGHF